MSFKRNASFWDTSFNEFVSFAYSTFNGTANYEDACFKSDAYFLNVIINDAANFLNTTFNHRAYFSNATFNRTANFKDGDFKGNAIFKGLDFKEVTFGKATFNGIADFDNTVFNKDADFIDAAFNDNAEFDDVHFIGDAKFKNSGFKIANFSEAQFSKEIHFEDAWFADKATFNSNKFDGDPIFENTTFQRDLSLTRAKYSKLFIRWHSLQGGLAYDDTAYMSLMKNFKDLGYYEDYDSCYYAYRKAHRAQEDWPSVPDWEEAIRKFIDRPLEWFYGYGTKPFNAFFWSLGIVMAFFIYWRWVGLGGPKDITKESLKDGEEWLDGDLTDILGYSVTVFLSSTKFFIDPPALPKFEGRSRSWIKKAFILERVLGALFSVLFFIAISGTIVRAS